MSFEVFARIMERVGGSAMPVTMANASQAGVKGIVSEMIKGTFIKHV